MSVQRRVNWISQQRVDLPDMRSVESAVSNDFDQVFQGFVTGTAQGYVVRGFNILMAGAIGGAATGLQMAVDPGAVMHIAASQSGTLLMVPAGTLPQQLNAATNSNVVGAFAPSAINYVSLDYIRFVDDTTSAQVYIWNPTTNNETTKSAPRAIILDYVINISTAIPSGNLLPLAVVTTDASNNVQSVTDARYLFGRLGTGGANPDPFFVYPWTQGRNENPSTSTNSGVDPFTGGDKNIGSLKEWMNAIMSNILEIKGTTYWYSPASSGSLDSLRQDLGNTVVTGSGNISHGIIPNSTPLLVTTGNIAPNNNQLTNLASVAGLAIGDYVFATGIPVQTTILGISGSTVTLSKDATLSGTGITVTFYSPSVITGPGQINWDQPIHIRVIGSELTYTLASNPTSSDITLGDDQVAYVTFIREASVFPNLIFTNGSQQVSSVGAVPWTTFLLPGDYLKLASDTSSGYYEINTVDSPTQVSLVVSFAGTSTGAAGAQGQYAFGSYSHSPSPSTNRDIFIANRSDVPQGRDVYWLFLRNDNGGAARVYLRVFGLEIDNGEDREVSGPTSDQLLKYVGSPMASATSPQYVSALNPNSLPEIQTLAFGTAAQTPANSYFYIYPAGILARQYYVWFNKDGAGVDPVPGLANNSIEVAISTGNTAAQIAAAVTLALNDIPSHDFLAVQQSGGNINKVLVANTSAGATNPAADGNVGSPFAVTVSQSGTGLGNNFIKDGDNLTLAIKELDEAIGSFFAAINSPSYDESIVIVPSGAAPPVTLNGPVTVSTNITLPLNSRLGNSTQKYEVGKGYLQVYLNGQLQRLGQDWSEVGAAGALSSQFSNLREYEVGDVIELRISGIGGGGNTGGQQGPSGPAGPTGAPGADAVGGPVNISTKSADYTVMLTDNAVLANCTGGPVKFTLPPAATAAGHVFYFKKLDVSTNAMTIMANGFELIDGLNTLSSTAQYAAYMLITDGTAWYVF